MKSLKSIMVAVLVLTFMACASMQSKYRGTFSGSPYFEEPPDKILFSDKELFSQALNLQYKGQLQSAIQLWEKFLAERPQSFEALNNLGMAYYSNDQLDYSIQTFESALEIKPSNDRIKTNLNRTFRFRVTLERENRNYAKAVTDLKKILPLVNTDKQEKVLREIEDVQEKILEETQKLNTVEAYESFITAYPKSVFAEKAKGMLQLLKPNAEIAKKAPEEYLPPISAKVNPPKTQFEEVAPLMEEKLMASPDIAESKMPEMKSGDSAMIDSTISESKLDDPSMMDSQMTDMDMSSERMAMDIPESELMVENSDPMMEESLASKVRYVKIMTKITPLNIRDKPSNDSRVIGKIKKGAVIRLIGENSNWYYIAYATGKTGWVSRQYSKEVK